MSTYSGLRVFVLLGIIFLLVGGAVDVHAQVASLEVFTDIEGYMVDVGDEVTVTFSAEPAGEVLLYITAENVEVISIQGANEHLAPVLPSNYTTNRNGELVVKGVFTDPEYAFIQAHWDRPHPADDFIARADFEIRVPLPPATLERVSGNNQHGEAATTLQPFVVVVKDRNGRGLSGIDVTFGITTGSGSLSSTRPSTDRLGRAATALTFGSEVGVYQVEASVVGYPWLMQTFTAAATVDCEVPPEPSRPTTLSIVSGYGQGGQPGSRLSSPFVVEVKDQYGDAFSGATVTFSPTQGSGRVSATTARTNSFGRAQTTLTLGSSAGVNVVRVTIAGISSSPQVFFTATAIEEPEPIVPEQPSTPLLPPVYWIEDNAIYYLPAGDEKEQLYVPTDGMLTGGLAVDMEGGRIYWTEKTADGMGRIHSANLEGSNVPLVNKKNKGSALRCCCWSGQG